MTETQAILFPEKQQAAFTSRTLKPLGECDVLVRANVSLISVGTEMFCFRGVFEANTTWASWVKYPFHPGYSLVGQVAEIGAAVTQVRVGDRVFASGVHSALEVQPTERVVPIPDGVTDDAAAWAAVSFIAQTAVRRAEHHMGDTAAVIGLGPIGQCVAQYLRVVGLRRVFAIDTAGQRLRMAAEHGATHTFEGSAAEARDFLIEHNEGELPDAVYDATGHFAVLPLALPLARRFGTVVLVGDSPEPTRQHLTQDVLARQVRIIGTHNTQLPPQHAHWTATRQIALFFDYLSRGQMRTDDMITHRYSPSQAQQAYDMLATRRAEAMGVVFDW